MDNEINENPNQFRQPQSPAASVEEPMGAKLPEPERELAPRPAWPNAVLIGLGVLLIVGGIAVGVRNRNNSSEIVDLPDYTVSEEPADVNDEESAGPTESPSAEASPSDNPAESPASPTLSSPAPVVAYKAPIIAKAKKKAVAKKVVAATSKPVASSSTANLPIYQAVVGLADYQPQFNSPAPSPSQQTITLRLVTPGHTYIIEAYQTVTVAALLEAARSQGLSYETKQFSFGAMVTSINGQSEGSGKYWTFTKNGAFSQLGISQQTVSNGDVIAWSLAGI